MNQSSKDGSIQFSQVKTSRSEEVERKKERKKEKEVRRECRGIPSGDQVNLRRWSGCGCHEIRPWINHDLSIQC